MAARVRGSVAAETFGGTRRWPLLAHSGPVYLWRRGKEVRVESDLRFLLDYTETFREFAARKGVFEGDEQRKVYLENIDEALALYRQRLRGR